MPRPRHRKSVHQGNTRTSTTIEVMAKSILELDADRTIIQRIIDGTANDPERVIFREIAAQARDADSLVKALATHTEEMRRTVAQKRLETEEAWLLEQTKKNGHPH